MDLNLNALKITSWIMLILIFISVVCPSFLLIFSFNNDLFFKLETIKLLFIGLSITTPVWLLNSFLVVLFTTTENKDEDFEEQAIGMIGCLFSFPVFYIPILVNFFGEITILSAVILSIVIEVLLIILGVIYFFLRRKRRKEFAKKASK